MVLVLMIGQNFKLSTHSCEIYVSVGTSRFRVHCLGWYFWPYAMPHPLQRMFQQCQSS